MSRYKKVITGEMELPEISGTKFLIYPTIDTRMDLLEHIKATQIIEEYDVKDDKGRITGTTRVKGKYFILPAIARTCAKMIFEGCYEHDKDGKRIKIKDDEAATTEDGILALVLESDIMAIYLEILRALDIIDKKKFDELKVGQVEEEKK